MYPAEKKTIEPCPKHHRKCNGFNGYNGNCIGFYGNYNGVYWYVMDSICVKSYWKNAQNTLQKGILWWFYWKKLMVHNGILMETIRIYVMVSIGLLLFFCRVLHHIKYIII